MLLSLSQETRHKSILEFEGISPCLVFYLIAKIIISGECTHLSLQTFQTIIHIRTFYQEVISIYP